MSFSISVNLVSETLSEHLLDATAHRVITDSVVVLIPSEFLQVLKWQSLGGFLILDHENLVVMLQSLFFFKGHFTLEKEMRNIFENNVDLE